jgi:hypothetical protein
LESASEFHFESSTTRGQLGVEEYVTCNTEGILQVALNFVEDILGCSTEDDRASVGFLTVGQEGEVIISNLSDFEKSKVGSDIRLLEFFGSVDNSGTA